ncbi:hypothetical protein D3C78_1959160 [compost metagenome]
MLTHKPGSPAADREVAINHRREVCGLLDQLADLDLVEGIGLRLCRIAPRSRAEVVLVARLFGPHL